MEIDQGLPVIQDADLEGKVVLVRVDHNVVKKGLMSTPTASTPPSELFIA